VGSAITDDPDHLSGKTIQQGTRRPLNSGRGDDLAPRQWIDNLIAHNRHKKTLTESGFSDGGLVGIEPAYAALQAEYNIIKPIT
jgi:hypothetical protein